MLTHFPIHTVFNIRDGQGTATRNWLKPRTKRRMWVRRIEWKKRNLMKIASFVFSQYKMYFWCRKDKRGRWRESVWDEWKWNKIKKDV